MLIQVPPSFLCVGGSLILVGSVFPDRPLELHAERIVRQVLRIQGVHNYIAEDLARAIRFLADNHERFPFQDLVEQQFSLDEVDRAVAFAEENRPIRVAIRPN